MRADCLDHVVWGTKYFPQIIIIIVVVSPCLNFFYVEGEKERKGRDDRQPQASACCSRRLVALLKTTLNHRWVWQRRTSTTRNRIISLMLIRR